MKSVGLKILEFEKKYIKYIAFFYVFIASFLFACCDLMIKFAHTVSTFQLVYFSSFISIILMYIFAQFTKMPLLYVNNKYYKYLHWRCIFGAIAVLTMNESFKIIPLTEAVVIGNTSPLWAPLFCYFLLNDPLHVLDIVFPLICSIGLLFISKPSIIFNNVMIVEDSDSVYTMPELKILGYLLCLGGSFTKIFVGICIKKLPNTTNPYIIVFYFNVCICIVGGIFMSVSSVKSMTILEMLIISAGGIFFTVGQLLYSRGFQIEKVGKVMIIAYSQLIFDIIFDIIFLNTFVDFWSIVGCGIIMAALLGFIKLKKSEK